MDQYHLPLFILNTLLVLLDAALGYHTAPRLLSGMESPEAVASGVRTTRALLSGVVALYMFFNCMGYFQGRTAYLLAVTALSLVDFVVQLLLSRKKRGTEPHETDEGE